MRRRFLFYKKSIYDTTIQPLLIDALDSGQIQFNNTTNGLVGYNINNTQWIYTNNNISVSVNAGDIVQFKGNLTPISFGIGTFSSTGKFNVSGNPKYLLKGWKLVDYAYYRLFYNCSNLINASNLILDDDVLAFYCYYDMFRGCTSLTIAPALPATVLASHCYSYMFQDCTSLTIAPELPATTLADSCYYSMFYNCTSLTTVPTELPATNLALWCYGYMFRGCAKLTTTPSLPATTLVNYCCYRMFYNCTSLTTAPELPATTLANSCYYDMFSNCTSLTTAPELPATTLAYDCYDGMFSGCSKLNKVICYATANINTTNLYNWLSGVSSKGDFYKVKDIEYPPGVSGIPTNWTRHDISPLRFIAIEEGQFSFTNDIQYKIDEGEWVDLKANELTTIVPANSTIYWKGELEPNYLNGIGTFSSTNKFKALGNPIQILKDWKLVDYAFSSLFYGCDKLTDASELVLDADTLTSYCCNSMFMNCTSLESAPILPATTLGIGCYSNMFNGCVNLINAPAINAPILADYCCNGMFSGCSSLKYVKSYTTDISATNCLYNWLDGVSSTGNFSTSIGEQYPTGPSGIPDNWEIIEI